MMTKLNKSSQERKGEQEIKVKIKIKLYISWIMFNFELQETELCLSKNI